MPNRTPAQLKKHYKDYQGTPEQIAKRSQRNQARQALIKSGAAKVGDGKDVHHKKPIAAGGTNTRSNLQVTSKSSNRGYARDAKNRPV